MSSSSYYSRGTRSPPPLHSPAPITPFHSLRAQWDILQHHLNQAAATESSFPSYYPWLRTLNRHILLTALTKQRSLIELLKAEASSSATLRETKCDLEFPDYNAGTPPPGLTRTLSRSSDVDSNSGMLRTTSSFTRLNLRDENNSNNNAGRSLSPRERTQSPRSPLHKIHLPADTGCAGDDDTELASEAERIDSLSPLTPIPNDRHLTHSPVSPTFSAFGARPFTHSPISPPSGALHTPLSPTFGALHTPLSPTFGARQFDRFSGTIERRRSLPPGGPPIPVFEPPRSEDADSEPDGDGREVELKDWERRVLWEAAWAEIEAHLEEYVGRLGGNGGNGNGAGDVYGGMDNEDLFMELVELKDVAGRLGERVRGEREDVRG